jgi:hypothetical protein
MLKVIKKLAISAMVLGSLFLSACQNPIGLENPESVARGVVGSKIIEVRSQSQYSNQATVPVYVSYQADQAIRLDVSFKNPTANWAWYGETSISLPAGIGVATVELPVQVVPGTGSGYVVEVKMHNAQKSALLDYKTKPILVVADQSNPSNKILYLKVPATIRGSENFYADVAFENSGVTHLQIQLRNTSTNLVYQSNGLYPQIDNQHYALNYLIYSMNSAAVPPAGTNYVVEAILYSNDDSVVYDTLSTPITVLPADKLFGAYATAPLQQGGTVPLALNYLTTAKHDFRIDLIKNGSEWVTGTQFSVDAGRSKLTKNITLPANLDLNANYFWSVKILPLGGQWYQYLDQINFDTSFAMPIPAPLKFPGAIDAYGAFRFFLNGVTHGYGTATAYVNKATRGPFIGRWVIHVIDNYPYDTDNWLNLETGDFAMISQYGSASYNYVKGTDTSYYSRINYIAASLRNMSIGRSDQMYPSPAFPFLKKNADYAQAFLNSLGQ